MPVVTRLVVKVTVDDYDYLYKGMNPKRPISITKENGLIRPDVSTWSELFAELMPIPCKKIEEPDSEPQMLTGGCTTSTIPVNKASRPTTYEIETAYTRGLNSRK